MKRIFVQILGFALMLISACIEYSLYYRNPDMSQFSMFKTYWYMYILEFVLSIVGILCIIMWEEK